MIIRGWCLTYNVNRGYEFRIDSYSDIITPNVKDVSFGETIMAKEFQYGDKKGDFASYIMCKIDRSNNLLDYIIWNYDLRKMILLEVVTKNG